ncbi:MAG: L-serine ammonia-lyase, iron-sulfur-dependent, subunit alpha [Clostridia bacterium]|nr:L-serine ammonia-lyase, iron-sulfur-dependent, subunit alpha [Clostridia bacterium]
MDHPFDYGSVKELVQLAAGGKISDVVLGCQAHEDEVEPQAVLERMQGMLDVMRESVKDGMQPGMRSNSGMVGGQAYQLSQAVAEGKTVSDSFLGRMEAMALSVAECNACMGRIVAAPTAGSCGILPGSLFSCQEKYGYGDAQLVRALLTAAGIGRIIAEKASISGAEGGCQAECGTAAAMAAAAMVELRGGSPEDCAAAVSLTLMNMMGLVCDPMGGLVEVPCVYRNVAGVVNAVAAADMALSGIRPPLDCDDVIETMGQVGRMIPESLRETGLGGCAACKSCSK